MILRKPCISAKPACACSVLEVGPQRHNWKIPLRCIYLTVLINNIHRNIAYSKTHDVHNCRQDHQLGTNFKVLCPWFNAILSFSTFITMFESLTIGAKNFPTYSHSLHVSVQSSGETSVNF